MPVFGIEYTINVIGESLMGFSSLGSFVGGVQEFAVFIFWGLVLLFTLQLLLGPAFFICLGVILLLLWLLF